MAEELQFNVKTNIKDAATDADNLSKALSKAQQEVDNLNENFRIQEHVISDLEDSVELLEKRLIDTPKAGASGWNELNKVLDKTKLELKGEKDAVKELKSEMKDAKTTLQQAADKAEDFEKGMKGATGQTKKLGKGVKGITKETKKLDKATKKGAKGFKGIGTAIKGVGLALKAAGIGLIVAALAKFLQLLGSNQKVVNTFETAMTALTIAFNDLFNYVADNISAVTEHFKMLFEDPIPSIEEMGTKIVENLLNRFHSIVEWYKVLAKTTMNFWSGKFPEALESAKEALLIIPDIFTGIDGVIGKVKDKLETIIPTITKFTKSTWEQAKAITEAKLQAQLAEVQFVKLNATYLKEAEVQRQIRDNVNLTFATRLAANEKLGKILDKQEKLQREQIQIRVNAAKLLHEVDEENIENKIAYLQVLNEEAELEETMAGQRSEQMTNQVGLENELREARVQTIIEGKKGLERELDELKAAYQEKLRLADQSGMDITAIVARYKEEEKLIKDTAAAEEIEKEKELAAAKVDLLKQGLATIMSFMDVQAQDLENNYNDEIELAEKAGKSTEDIENKYEGKRREQAKKFQTMKIAMAVVDTYQSAVAAYANALNIPIAGLALAPIAASLAVLAGLANIAMIKKQPLGGGGGGGGGTAATGATPPAPQMVGGQFELTQPIPEQDALRAYVVTDEMTNSQDQLANIRRRATI